MGPATISFGGVDGPSAAIPGICGWGEEAESARPAAESIARRPPLGYAGRMDHVPTDPRPVGPEPRTTLIAGALVVVAVMALTDGMGTMAALAVWSVAGVAAGAGRGAAAALLRRLAPVCVVLIALNGVFLDGAPVFAWHDHTVVSREGLVRGVFFSMRLLAMVGAFAAVLALLKPEGVARGLHAFIARIHPRAASVVALHGYLAAAFVPLFASEFRRVREAQRFRLESPPSGLVSRALQTRAVLVPLIVSAIHRSDTLHASIRLRRMEDRIRSDWRVVPLSFSDLRIPGATLLVVLAGWFFGRG